MRKLTVVTIYNITPGFSEIEAELYFAGDCLSSPREQAEDALRKLGFVPLTAGGEEWEELGIENKQATIREENSHAR